LDIIYEQEQTMYLVTADEMREMDHRAIESFGLPGRVLMENAGRGATRFLTEQFDNLNNMQVAVIAGRGNNGGDGYVIARYLSHKDVSVVVYLLSDPARVTGDAAANLKLLAPLGIPVIQIENEKSFADQRPRMRAADLWIDAILGTGLKSDVKGFYRKVIDFINSLEKPVFAVDIPSGLNSDTGQPCGTCIRASATATFGFAKTGHYIYPGAEYTGNLQVVDIGIPPHVTEEVAPKQHLLDVQQIKSGFKMRAADAHKGRTGHLLAIAGSPGKTGAAAMTAASAVRSGAGLVTLAVPTGINAILESQLLEAMTCPLPETATGVLDMSSLDQILSLLADKQCLALGPGLGQDPATKKLVLRLLTESPAPIVVDADGLNCLAGDVDTLNHCKAPVILTPHPGEMARLASATVKDIQADRITCAREFSCTYKVHLVLKGANTVITHPDGSVYINTTGNSGMASGGMGDVLTGLIAGFVTQGFTPESACHAGAYLHGAAADTLSKQTGPVGYIASEVMDRVPAEMKQLLYTGNDCVR
jgi:NAD(P)H-hydrate epimerase